MRELSLHILDIVQNSIKAEADLVQIIIKEDIRENILQIKIKDNGKGMEINEARRSIDPFVTGRKTREVGLGLSFFSRVAEESGGKMTVNSTPGEGTEVIADFVHDHIDRPPLGDICQTLITIIALNPEIDIKYCHRKENKEFCFSTEDFRKELADIKLNENSVLNWIKEYMKNGLNNLYGGE